MSATTTSDPEWIQFRKTIITALVAIDRKRFHYIDKDTMTGACPICTSGYVVVRFHGTAPRADLDCSLGCAELEVARAIGSHSRKAVR